MLKYLALAALVGMLTIPVTTATPAGAADCNGDDPIGDCGNAVGNAFQSWSEDPTNVPNTYTQGRDAATTCLNCATQWMGNQMRQFTPNNNGGSSQRRH